MGARPRAEGRRGRRFDGLGPSAAARPQMDEMAAAFRAEDSALAQDDSAATVDGE